MFDQNTHKKIIFLKGRRQCSAGFRKYFKWMTGVYKFEIMHNTMTQKLTNDEYYLGKNKGKKKKKTKMFRKMKLRLY